MTNVLGTMSLGWLRFVGAVGGRHVLARTDWLENRAEADRLAAAGRGAKRSMRSRTLRRRSRLSGENPDYWLALVRRNWPLTHCRCGRGRSPKLLRAAIPRGGRESRAGSRPGKRRRIYGCGVGLIIGRIYGHWDRDAETNRTSVRFRAGEPSRRSRGSKEEVPGGAACRCRGGAGRFGIAGAGWVICFSPPGRHSRAGGKFFAIFCTRIRRRGRVCGVGPRRSLPRGSYQAAHQDFQTAEICGPPIWGFADAWS